MNKYFDQSPSYYDSSLRSYDGFVEHSLLRMHYVQVDNSPLYYDYLASMKDSYIDHGLGCILVK